VTCMTTMANNFVTPTTTTTTATAPAGSRSPGGSGVTGLTGSAPGAGGSTGPPTGIVGAFGSIPSGGPQTGFGGASRSRDSDLLFASALAFGGAGLALTLALVRRRTLFPRGVTETP
jgi:hypothetical protein